MGGSALKSIGIHSTRMDLNMYSDVKTQVSRDLRELGLEFYIPIEYSDKTSFGDLDILVLVKDETQSSLLHKYIRKFKYTKNSSIYSLAYPIDSTNTVQVDIIRVSHKSLFESSKHYLNYDNSQVLGVIFRRAGFRLKPQGLYMYSSKISRDLFVTGDYQRIFTYLHLSFKNYLESYTNPLTFEQYIQFVSESPFFDYRYFQLDQLSSRRRIRLRKRKSYIEFLNTVNSKYKKEAKYSTDVLRQRILHDNPQVLKSYENEYMYQIIVSEVKERFNGKLVMKYTGLSSGPILGSLMKHLKSKYSCKYWLSHSDLEIKNTIIREYKKLRERV